MNTRNLGLNIRLIAVLALLAGLTRAESVGISTSKDALDLELLAAQEVSRYVYLRTGALPGKIGHHGTIVIAQKNSPAITDEAVRAASRDLQAQQYVLKTTTSGNKKTWWIVGGDGTGTLYGAYRFAEKLGVRFYLHGDVIPDERLTTIPEMEETGKPLFALRGVNPWGSHPFGFDAWGAEDYKAIFSQLAKMRMNFLGIHCYPEGHPYAEPTVWLGTKDDFDAQGNVKSSYPSHYYNTLVKGTWGPILPKKTSEYSFGGSQLFEDDSWAPDVMRGHCPVPETPEACNEVFNRMAAQFRDAFSFARELGVKTCVGTEAPMILPKALRERLTAQGKNPKDPATVREVYEGMFRRIAASHPLDYFWIWTPEGWTLGGNKPEQYSNTVSDVKLAIEALKDSGAPFKLATCGWVLGPQHDRAAFDNDLPKNIPMSAISRRLGYTEVDPAYGKIQGREKWAIPWFESDGNHGLAALQPFVGRMRRDAADALAYGCTGLMGLQWRTDILAPNIAALAEASWDQSGWNPAPGKLPVDHMPIMEGPVGGSNAHYPGRKIANTTTHAPLYQTCRYGMEGYNLKMPNGRYRVTLKFCEPHFDKPGERVGDFKLQGKTVVEGLDIFKRVGKFAALDLTFDNIEVTDGWLRLGVEARKSMPCISAIAIEGTAATRKINCGGAECLGYEADEETVKADKKRFLPCDDFYADWALANFGAAGGSDIGRVFTALDGRLPMSVAGGCPSGALKADPKPWIEVATNYHCVTELEQLQSSVKGLGNRERFDYWLNTFRYHRALHQVRCTLGAFDALLKEKKSEAALAKYRELIALYGETYRLMLETVNSPGGLATVVNLENHSQFWPTVIEEPAKKLEALLGHPLSEDMKPPKTYSGKSRIIVPTVRSVARKDEAIALRFIVLDSRPANAVTLVWRPLGAGDFRRLPAQLQARATYHVPLPRSEESFEYRIEVQTADEKTILWPATAPEMNQTVVVW
jgi:hypothetical protein